LLPALFVTLLALAAAIHGAAAGGPPEETAASYRYRVIRTYPHDRRAFTQGLVYEDGVFYEGTGLYGLSALRKWAPETGRVLKEIRLDPSFFGEGITILGDRILQLTWQSRVGFVYDKKSFVLLGKFTYPHEGWGITHDGRRIVMSDGTPVLHVLDPKDFHETATIKVFDQLGPVMGLNELEYVRGAIYANVWTTDRIAVVNPRTGRVGAWIDLKGLLPASDSAGADVLNGIAYDAPGDRLFVTGKLWPKVFELKIIPERRTAR
jgi:glutaminyl-peptide cyclotransferase